MAPGSVRWPDLALAQMILNIISLGPVVAKIIIDDSHCNTTED